MARINRTFGKGYPTWANACVGNNGCPGYWDYARGFSQAANLLIDKVLQSQGIKYPVDVFVYPICFNMRHSVELRLKDAILELRSLEEYRSRSLEYDLAGSHDIGNLWQFFTEKSAAIDDRYININNRLDTKIVDIAEIDATGQTFRYPIDTQRQTHLLNVGVINFVNLKRSFSELEALLDELHHLNEYLLEEYAFNTFTKKLSRKNIFEIASILPHRTKWKEPCFDSVKNNIKQNFKIGSNELSASIKIIETHFELAPMIGSSVALLGLVEKDLVEFAEHWFTVHKLSSDSDPIKNGTKEWCSEDMFRSITRDAEFKQEAWRQMASKLTPEIMAGLLALFYFAHDLDFSERYACIYKECLGGSVAAFERSQSNLKTQFFHILDKRSAIHNIVKSLLFLKKGEEAERLVSAHGLDRKFSWLDEARSRSLFMKPEYCGYVI
ncbi:conserved hypothetical protein [Thiocapsa sp. KS1]|nr:hypothetical protein [Thiocapsa sp. KS1]CRI63650.1 conserved hypothetical protein [Thiocapsa sp. KS1]